MVSYKPVYKNLSRTFIGIIQNSCKDKLKLGNVGEVLKFRFFSTHLKFKVKCNNVYGWLKARSLSSKRRKHWLKNPIWTERLISVLHPLFMMNGAKFRYTLVVCWINAGILWCDFGVAITVFLGEMKMLTLIMLYGNCCQGNCPNLHKSSERGP